MVPCVLLGKMAPLIALLAVTAIYASANRVHWYLGSYDSAYAAENTAFLAEHMQIVDGVLHCCTGLQVLSDGSMAPANRSLYSHLIETDRGHDPIMIPISPSTEAVQARVAHRAIPALVQWVSHANISGLISDYEPHANTTSDHADAYASFLTDLGAALHAAGKRLAVCISDWGILGAPHWPAYARAAADMYVSMGSTYAEQGPGDILAKAHVLEMKAAFPLESLAVGVGTVVPDPQSCAGTTDDYKWTEKSFDGFLTWLEREGVTTLAIWPADIAALLYKNAHYCGAPPWLYSRLKAFREGRWHQPPAERFVSLDPPHTFWPPAAEIENFTVSPPGAMLPTGWGRQHYFGATFSDTFASRLALLHAPASAVASASGRVSVPSAGTWYVCVRYEAPYRFEVDFTVTASQSGVRKLAKLYGRRSSPKIWPFGWSQRNHQIAGCGANPTPECHWTWGATEGWVWEFYPARLTAGEVEIKIEVANTTRSGVLGDRNLDVVLLTNNLTDIRMRMVNEQQLALDGLLSQHDEVFLRVANSAADPLKLSVPYGAYHSAYASQHLICIPFCHQSSNGKVYSSIAPLAIEVKARSTSEWVEVGSRLDSFNDGSLTVHSNLTSPGGFTVEYGLRQGNSILPLGTFASTSSTSVEVAFSANTRATRWVRPVDFDVSAALQEADTAKLPRGRSPPQLTPIFGYSFCDSSRIRDIEPNCYLTASTSPSYARETARFASIFPISDTNKRSKRDPALAGDLLHGRGYFEARTEIHNLTKLQAHLENMSATGLASDVLVVSLGDEIVLSVPTDPTLADKAFAEWQAKHHTPTRCPHFNASWKAGDAK